VLVLLPPDQLFKILVSGDDNAVFPSSPLQDLGIFHSGVHVRHPKHIMTMIQQPTRQRAAGIDIRQEFSSTECRIHNETKIMFFTCNFFQQI